MQKKEYSMNFAGKPLAVEFTDLADQADGSVLVTHGKTKVFASAVMSKKANQSAGWFPLVVNYEEKFYSAGKILGSRFMRREGRPSDEATLTSRIIDRTIRPLFNHSVRNEIQIIVYALTVDGENDTDIPAVIAASLAIATSDIPWGGPVGATRICLDENGGFVINGNHELREKTKMDIIVCGGNGKLNMIEAGAKEVDEKTAAKAIAIAQEEINKLEEFQQKIISEIGKPKRELDLLAEPSEMQEMFDEHIYADLEKAIYTNQKSDTSGINDKWHTICEEKFGEEYKNVAEDKFEKITDSIIHKNILENDKRPDGRKMDEIRHLYAEVGYLPELHGTGVFYRGATHVLSALTLGGPEDGQLLDGIEVNGTKHFMHHYNFPPFSTGETGRVGSPGRREIGHGALAEKAIQAVIPSREEFPYTIRIVSEAMASNGSTSMASTCASILALMDAGVPIKAPVAGIAMGVIVDPKNDKNYKILTDIQGPEDHYGDMDFKCAGTKDGITAIQMDIKLDGVTVEMLTDALDRAKKARLEILDVMTKTISAPRPELHPNAPRIYTIKINPELIGKVIGPGGKMINSIIAETGAGINIEDDGTVFVTSNDADGANKALAMIEGLTHEYKPGEIVKGKVVKLFDFGAMVEFGNTDGLIHISKMVPTRIEKVTDVLREGDEVTVEIIEKDEKGRLNLRLKEGGTGKGEPMPPQPPKRQFGGRR